ncbi:MAG: hypothetical protein JXR30_02210 [Alphaproteobacteria bacterium]|nr:hypothetical protein [Alphaproteobacteria bacterium]
MKNKQSKGQNMQFIVLLAGKSTRNYPQSKGLPHKALLPLGDKKVIDHIIQPIIQAGGKEITFVISNEENKLHFDRCFEHEPYIEEKFEKKKDFVRRDLLRECYLPDNIKINYVVQSMPLGVGHAIALASKEDSPVCFIYPDDVIFSNGTHPYVRAVEEFNQTGQGNVIVTRPVDDPSRWGIIENGLYVEKPQNSTSNEAVISCIIIDKAIVKHLKNALQDLEEGESPAGMIGDELTHIHALNLESRAHKNQRIRTIPLTKDDMYLDCGTLEGYEKSFLYSLIFHSKLKEENKEWITQLLKNSPCC